MELLDYVAAQIRNLRTSYHEGEGMSQETLAGKLQVAANTISRWETGIYRPSLEDLEKLARFFEVPISSFFPPETDNTDDENWVALLRTAKQLHSDDLKELRKYAEFRKARRLYEGRKKNVARRKSSKHNKS